MQPATRRWLIVIVLAGAALRIFPIWFGLPFPLARPDEETTLGKAVGIINGDLNPHFFNWPSFTFYVLATAIWAFRFLEGLIGEARPLTFAGSVVIGRGVIALAGVATVAAVFHLGRRVAGERVALLSALFLAVAILHVRDSHFAMTDVLTTLLVVLSFIPLMRVVVIEPRPPKETATSVPVDEQAMPVASAFTRKEGIPRKFRTLPPKAAMWCALAGLAGGLAASTKYSAAAIAASMVAAQILWFVRAPGLMLTVRGWMPLAAYGLAMAAGFLIGTPYALLDFATFSRDLRFELTHLSTGHAGMTVARGWTYHATRSLPYGVGLGVFIAAIVGLVPFARRYGRAGYVLGAFAAAFYIVIGSGHTVFFRYMMPLVPLVCLAAAIGVHHAAAWISARFRLASPVALAVLLALTAGPALVHSVWFDVLLARADTRVLAGRWLEERLRADDSLYDDGSNYTRLDLTRARFHRWHYEEARDTFGDPGGRTPDWVILNESPLSTYAATSPALQRLVDSKYQLIYAQRATESSARSGVYDLQDAFFLPLSGLWTIERPGPDVLIYRRRDLRPVETIPDPSAYGH